MRDSCANHNQSYTKDQITELVKRIKIAVRHRQYKVELNENRTENIDFINDFLLTDSDIQNLILSITADDFCHSLKNTKKGYEHETLYVFVPESKLTNLEGEENMIKIYTKFNLIKISGGTDYAIIISLHQPNKPVNYAFK